MCTDPLKYNDTFPKLFWFSFLTPCSRRLFAGICLNKIYSNETSGNISPLPGMELIGKCN